MKNKTSDRILQIRKYVLHLSQDRFSEKIAEQLNRGLESPTFKCPKRETIRKWECGESAPDLQQLQAIAELTEGKYDVGYLLGLYDEKNYSVKQLCEQTRLSQAASEFLFEHGNEYSYNNILISWIIESERFPKLLELIGTAVDFSLDSQESTDREFQELKKILLRDSSMSDEQNPFCDFLCKISSVHEIDKFVDLLGESGFQSVVLKRESARRFYISEAGKELEKIIEEMEGYSYGKHKEDNE